MLRALWRLPRAALHGAHGLALVLWVFPRLDRAGRRARVQWWSRGLLRALGIGLEVRGTFAPGPKLVVCNHVSWLDIMVVHAVCPEARFIAKAEVKRWPIAARLVDAAETLYIERASKRDALRVVHDATTALRAGDTVAVFPEGTTGDARALLPFHANLLQAAVSAPAPVQPLALRWSDAEAAVSPAALWVGQTTLLQTFWRLARARGLTARLAVLPARDAGGVDRRALAEALTIEVSSALDEWDRSHPHEHARPDRHGADRQDHQPGVR